MNFKMFAHILRPIIGQGKNIQDFTRILFEKIVTDEGLLQMEDYSESSFKAYYGGQVSISSLAQKIYIYVEPEKFSGYISDFPDAVVQSLCESFEEYLPEITLFNAGDMLAGLFEKIIKEAASSGNREAGDGKGSGFEKKMDDEGNSSAECGADFEAEVVDDEESSGAASGKQETIVIQHQTNVIQKGKTNVNMTNNGTLTLNF